MTVSTRTNYKRDTGEQEYAALLRTYNNYVPNPRVEGQPAGLRMKARRDPQYGNVNAEYAQVVNPVGQHLQSSHPGNIVIDDEVSAKNRTGNLVTENSQTIVDKDPETVVEDGITAQVGRQDGGFNVDKMVAKKFDMFTKAFKQGNAHDGNNNRFNSGRLN